MAQTSYNHPPNKDSNKSVISHIERNDGPNRHSRSTSLDSVASSTIFVHPPTPDGKSNPPTTEVFFPSSRSTTSSLRHAIFADHSSPTHSPDAENTPSKSSESVKPAPASLGPSVVSRPRSSRSPSSSYFTTTSDPSNPPRTPSGQMVRPPRRRKDTSEMAAASPFGSPRTSPATTPGGSKSTSPKIGGPEPHILDEKTIAELTLRKKDVGASPSSSASTTPTSSTPVSSAMNSPLAHTASLPALASSSSSADTTKAATQPSVARTATKPASLAVLNKRRLAQGRPSLRSTSSEVAASALRINLDVLGRPKFDPTTQTFVTDHNIPSAPHTTASSSFGPRIASPLIRKKSGELVKSSLKSSAFPSYDANPLSAASTASVVSDDTSDSPFGYSKSLPATPSCPKYVHFDTRLERVRLFLAEQKPAAVSRAGSPSDENGLGGSGSEGFPFPSTSDEDEVTRKSLEIRLSNFPLQRPFDADVFLDSLSLTEDARSLKGIIHVRNLAFNKRVTIRFTSDSWSTTSEITGTYLDSIKGNSFDRFTFLIKLDDFMSRIEEKTLWLCIRYNVEGREMWDSNEGKNFQVEFRKRKNEGQMKASELRELRKRSATSTGVNRGGTQWSDQSGEGGLPDRMADLKTQLSRLAADFDSDHESGIPSPSFRQSPLLNVGVLSPNPSPSPLAARYDFGASLKNPAGWDRSSALRAPGGASSWEAPPATFSPSNPVTPIGSDNPSPAAFSSTLPHPSSPFPASSDLPTYPSNGPSTDGSSIGLRFDPAAAFGESPRKQATSSLRLSGLPDTFSNFDRTLSTPTDSSSKKSNAPFGSPRDLDGFAHSSRFVPSQPEPTINYLKVLTPGGSLSPTPINPILAGTMSPGGPPLAGRNHARSSYGTQSLDYFSAINVRRTPPTTPGALDSFSGPPSPVARLTPPSPREAPPANPRHSSSYSSTTSSSSSSSAFSDSMASPLSQLSTTSIHSSLSGTSSPITPPGAQFDAGRSHDPSLSAPRPGRGATGAAGSHTGMSFSDVVNQFCFYTGDRPTSSILDPNLPSPASTTVSLPSDLGISTSSNPSFSPSSSFDGDLTLDATPTSAASGESFFSAGHSSGLTTPTNHTTPEDGNKSRHDYFLAEDAMTGAGEIQMREEVGAAFH